VVNEKISSGNSWTILVKVRSTSRGRAEVALLKRRYADYVNSQTLPTNLVNFGQAVDFPLLLSITLAIFGAATLAHLLFVSVGRRRRQFALVKVLGFTRRQVRAAMYWQAITVSFVGVVFGVPLGIVVGKLIWRDFASSAGAVPFAVVPGASVTYLALAIVAAALALATIPAILGARIHPAAALREA
jgi:ABC-type antimicrobial peptide transport system permease subunit